MFHPEPFVIVVGAGPSGLLLALLLIKHGISVQILELSSTADEQPRATHYGSPAVHELQRAGVADEIRSAGFIPRGVSWRKPDGTKLGYIDSTVLNDYPNRMVCLPLNELSKILMKHLTSSPLASILWDHKVVSVDQDAERAYVDVATPQGTKRLSAPYIVGCDGANSTVRRRLFGDWEFPGKTWKEQVVATNVYYDFYKFGLDDANFYIDRENWFMASRITNDGLWRVTYGDTPGLTTDELRARQPAKFQQMLPGNPGPNDYKLANFSPYKVHQRLAKKMRVGRICLAADAAHLCNPFGGLGLTGGMVDAGGLADCLAGIFDGRADESILDKYDEIRRAKYTEIVDPISSENFRRCFDQDPETALENDEFLKLLKTAESDRELARAIQLGANTLQHDFTQYYKGTSEATEPEDPPLGTGSLHEIASSSPAISQSAVAPLGD